METNKKVTLTVRVMVGATIDKVWERWNSTTDIVKWYYASSDWHTPLAENDLHEGGRFSYRMEAKDGSAGFDFSGKYERVLPPTLIGFILDDERKVEIEFIPQGIQTEIIETFEAESVNTLELQRAGWQAILNNFKLHVETTE